MAYTTIDDPELYFQVKLYTGNNTAIGSGGLANTFDGDEDMQPDLVWIKARADAESHKLYDSVRGVTKDLEPDLYAAEGTNTEGLTAFGSDGFTIGNYSSINASSQTYVAWCWKAGTAGSGTTTGSGTGQAYTYSVDTTSGVSIMAYTGNGTANHTIPHHLGVVPNWFMVKIRSGDNNNWGVYHHKSNSSPEQYALYLDSTHAATDDIFMNDVAPTSSVINLSGGNYGNVNTNTYVAFCFAEKQGFSKFGSYTGNGNADGTFVHLGFRPAFLMVKASSATSAWYIYDNKRAGYNPDNNQLYPDRNNTEDTTDQVDLLSNGFKWKAITGDPNTSGRTYVYMAFAEAPFVNSNGVPCNAR